MKLSTLTLTTTALAGILLSLGTMSRAEEASDSLTSRDRHKIFAQKICPVTGEPLGSMGTPLKVKIGKEELFLCCKGCTQGQVSREHWARVHANLAQAQGKCPVMGHDLPKNPQWTIVKGQIVYVCCPPCTKKIEADPQTYLTKLDKLYEAAQRQSRAAGNASSIPR